MSSAEGQIDAAAPGLPALPQARSVQAGAEPSIGKAGLGAFRGSRRLEHTRRAGTGTLLGSAPGFILPFVIAREFGATRAADAYFLSVSSVLFCTTLFSIALETSIVPFAIEWRAEGAGVFATRIRRVIGQATGAIVATYAVVAIGVVELLGVTSFDAAQKHTVRELLILLSPLPALATATSALSGALNGWQSFFRPAITQGLRSLAGLAVAVGVGHRADALYFVAAALSVGECLRLSLLVSQLRRLVKAEVPVSSAPAPKKATGLWRVVAPQVFSMMVVGLNPIVDKTVAATLPIGSVTLVELAERLYLIPRVLASSAVGVVSASTWAGHHVGGDRDLLRRDYVATQRATWIAGTAVAVVLGAATFAAAPLIQPVFHISEHKLFVELTVVFLVGLPAALSADLGTRLLTATRETRVLPLFAVINFVVNIGADVVGAWLWGPIGIAAASTIMRFGASGMYGLYIKRQLRLA